MMDNLINRLRNYANKLNQQAKKIQELEAELKVAKSFHDVAVEQRDTEIKHNQELQAQLAELKGLAKRVMDLLEEHGASILPHLLDTDENAGQQLREALEEVKGE